MIIQFSTGALHNFLGFGYPGDIQSLMTGTIGLTIQDNML